MVNYVQVGRWGALRNPPSLRISSLQWKKKRARVRVKTLSKMAKIGNELRSYSAIGKLVDVVLRFRTVRHVLCCIKYECCQVPGVPHISCTAVWQTTNDSVVALHRLRLPTELLASLHLTVVYYQTRFWFTNENSLVVTKVLTATIRFQRKRASNTAPRRSLVF